MYLCFDDDFESDVFRRDKLLYMIDLEDADTIIFDGFKQVLENFEALKSFLENEENEGKTVMRPWKSGSATHPIVKSPGCQTPTWTFRQRTLLYSVSFSSKI